MSLHLLTPQEYDRIRPLFTAHTPPSLYCQGILAGKYAGKVLVDDATHPHSALVIKDIWCHLIGDPTNTPFNDGLRLVLAEKQFIDENTTALFFIDPTEAWCKALDGLVEGRQPIETPRYVYVATSAIRSPALPEGFALRFIDESLSEAVLDGLPEDVQKVLALRKGANTPDEMALGHVAIYGRSCAAWSVIDYIVGEVGEIRLVTQPQYRRCGLATATSAAALNYGLSHGLKQIHWDVAASNIGSIRTAEKLGLQRLHEAKEYLIIFPEVGYLINLAWSHLDRCQFAQTQTVAAQMIASDKKILVQYGQFLAGAAWAGLGELGKAVDHLNKAVDAGFDDLPEMQSCPPLTILHKSPEWVEIVTRIKNL